MCYHYSMNSDRGSLEKRYKALLKQKQEQVKLPLFHTSGFSHPALPVITSENPGEISFLHWGLIPFWVKDEELAKKLASQTLNAKSETVFEKPSFRAAVVKRRCLVPATGFFEWMHFKEKKYPHLIRLKNTDIFSFGGIWERWTNKETGEIRETFSIVTTPANPLMEKIHNSKKRMPLILATEDEKLWLDTTIPPAQTAKIMQPFPEDAMEAYTISKRITSRSENPNTEETLKKFSYPELN